MELALALVEASEDAAPLMAALIDNFSAKQPKIVTGCAQIAAKLVSDFGPSVVDVKPLLKVSVGEAEFLWSFPGAFCCFTSLVPFSLSQAIPKLFEHMNKDVRDQGRAIVLALYSYIGEAVRPSLKQLKPVQVRYTWRSKQPCRHQTRFLLKLTWIFPRPPIPGHGA